MSFGKKGSSILFWKFEAYILIYGVVLVLADTMDQ